MLINPVRHPDIPLLGIHVVSELFGDLNVAIARFDIDLAHANVIVIYLPVEHIAVRIPLRRNVVCLTCAFTRADLNEWRVEYGRRNYRHCCGSFSICYRKEYKQ